ncbi:MAG: MFS transporter, partial [Eggerthellaceae bacterium]|nr:MFS transporter [Eggerthellaceae bacterium]
ISLLAPVLTNALVAIFGGRIMDKRGVWPLLPAGFAFLVVGTIASAIASGQISWIFVTLAAVVVYIGVGLTFSPNQTAGLQTLNKDENSHGVALLNVFIQMAAAVGPSLFMGIYSSVSSSATAAGQAEQVAQAAGFTYAMIVAAAIAFAGFVIVCIYARMRVKNAKAITQEELSEHVELTVKSVMKKPYVISANATVRDAMKILVERKTSGLPVVDDDQNIVGFITDGDLLGAMSKIDIPVDLGTSLAPYLDLRDFDDRAKDALNTRVIDIATKTVISVDVNTPIDAVCDTLSSKKIKKVPVLEGRKVVGTISRSDIVRKLMIAYAEGEAIQTVPDAQTIDGIEPPDM